MDSSRRSPSDLQLTSKSRASTALAVGLPLVIAAALAIALIAPPDWSAWRMFALIAAVSWLAWAIWGWPRVEVGDTSITVRNALTTWQIPLHEISDIESGRKFTLALSNGSVVTAAAVSGDDIALEAWRRTDAATQGGHFVRNADDARISTGAQSVASRWAKQLRERVRDAPDSARGPIVRRVNWGVIAVSVAVVVLLVAAITAFP
jgi:hypothetical protein